MYLAIKEIKKEKGRFAMILIVMTFIAYLVFFLSSLAYGLASINRTALDQWQFDSIILNKDANQNALASFITNQQIESMDLNVKDALRIRGITATFGDEQDDAILIGADASHFSDIVTLQEGEYPQTQHDILISADIRNEKQLNIGDSVRISKYGDYKIIGITTSSNYNTRPVFYTNLEGSELDDDNLYNVILGTNSSEDFETLSKAELIDNLPGYKAQILTFGLMIGALSIISALIIGVFMYILTMQKKPIFGILKVQGFKNKTVISSIIIQTFILTGVGLGLGFILSEITCYALKSTVPVATYVPLSIGVTIAMIVFSLLGSLFSSRIILKIDPLKSL
ncbi:ABC transporter permease [Erysipelothrix rhusiopathiae]|nr:ABC transporter permease [Erysipelothrix rhusiopathiae]